MNKRIKGVLGCMALSVVLFLAPAGTALAKENQAAAYPAAAEQTAELPDLYGAATKYTITYVLDGGTNAAGNPAVYTSSTATITLLAPERTGQKFVGWYLDSACTKKVTQIPKGSSGNITVYAKWSPIKYTISFDGNRAASGSMAELTGCKYGTGYDLPANAFARPGYEFLSWNTAADGSGTSFANQENVKRLSDKDGDVVTLYAQWKKLKYKVNYVLDGGVNSAENPTGFYITSATVTLLEAQKTGYRFSGWYTDAAFSKKLTQIEKGSYGDITLYAKWTPIKYIIRLDGNGATGGEMADRADRKYDQSYTLPANTYEKNGYTFGGWNTAADGSGTAYANKASVKNLCNEEGQVIVLYAQWKKTKFTVSYELLGGTNDAANPTGYYITTATITLASPVKKGYSFSGWYTDAAYTAKVTQIKKGSFGNITLYAKWTPIKYTIRLDGNTATDGSMADREGRKYDQTYSLPANTFVKNGYVFAGWNTKADGTGKSYANKAEVKNLAYTEGKIVTLYAQWTKAKYTITYNLKGGTANSPLNPSTYTVTTASIVLEAPVRTGYKFLGWYSDSAYTTKVTKIAKGSYGNLTLYARWTAIKYNVAFQANGGTGSMSEMTGCKYNTEYKLNQNQFTKADGFFAGWNTKADGSGTYYAECAPIKNLTSTDGKTITLYAVWKSAHEIVDNKMIYNVRAVGQYINWDGVSNVAQFTDYAGNYCFALDSDDRVLVVKTQNGEVVSTLELNKTHPTFGALISDNSGYYYMVTGETNSGSDTSVNTVFITKYTPTGTVMKTVGDNGSSSLAYYYGTSFYTKIPFDAGNCDVAINGGKLAVNYAREMYSGHQSNSVWIVDTQTLDTLKPSISMYNSHSFAQRVIPLGSGFVYASEGDCYERAFTINVDDGNNVQEADIFNFWVPEGTYDAYDMWVLNNNFAHMGDLAVVSGKTVAFVGTSVEALSEAAKTQKERVFVQIFDTTKNMNQSTAFLTSGIRSGVAGKNGDTPVTDYGVQWLTPNNGKSYTSAQAVSDGNGKLVVLFEQYDSATYRYEGVYYMVLNERGEVLKGMTLFAQDAMLNPCQTPVYANGHVYWTSNKRYDNSKELYTYILTL